jgi:asparagine synthase (glutamine-hydrolysing)
MCGIAGIVGPTANRLSAEDRGKALDLMKLRGPDASGEWEGENVWFGHRRLAIIDLSPRGHQPMFSPDKRYACILNGEIYNFRDIRARLEERGIGFVGGSDTEVLLHAYAEWGVAALDSLDGMFAFAIWDERDKKLLVARDRFGEKPLYCGNASDGSLVFASDPKAVLELAGRPLRIDKRALVGDLVYGYQLDSNTVMSGVRMLPPASYLLVDRTGRTLSEAVYWRWRPAERPRGGRYEDYLGELEASLRTMVRRRLISDRPLGVLLSGGIDSSLTAAIAAQEAGRQVDAYTIRFDDGEFDESPHARAVAEKVGLRHHVLPPTDAHLDELPRLLWHYGVPFHDFSCIPTAAAFEAVATQCVVCLTGDGGDEMFAGYSEPLLFRWLSDYGRIPSPLRGILREVLAPARGLGRPGQRMAKWSRLGSLPHEESFAIIKDYIWNGGIPLRGSAFGSEAAAARSAMEDAYRGTTGGAVQRYLQAHAATQFASDFLVKVDVAAMAHSVESRTPFLSPEVAELAGAAPTEWLLNGGTPKRILRDLALRFLPAAVVHRPKQGFTPPLRNWLRGPLKGSVEQLLSPGVVERRRIFEPEPVARLLADHLAGRADHTTPLWVLTSLEIWWRLLVDASASPEMKLTELSRLEPKLSIDDVAA